MTESESPESIPGCAGQYGAPIAENGPCERCFIKELCQKLSNAKKALGAILDAVVEMRQILRGENT
jgi:hypothetical protein